MMGRTPDFLNVSLMAMAGAGDYFARNREEFKRNIVDYYEYVGSRTGPDPYPGQPATEPRPGRHPRGRPNGRRAVRGPGDGRGIVVRGPRVLATLGPLADEIAVYPARSHRLPGNALDRYAFAFAVPCGTPGLRFLCRESYDLGRSTFDHPLGSRFEEMDAIVFFDDVLVPWERGVPVRRHRPLQQSRPDHQPVHAFGHQVVTKNVAKCEFVVGLANPGRQDPGFGERLPGADPAGGVDRAPRGHEALLCAAEVTAEVDQWGDVSGAPRLPSPVTCSSASIRGWRNHPAPRLQQPDGAAGEVDFSGPLGQEIEKYLETDTATARERVQLFHLAWDLAAAPSAPARCSMSASQGDWMRNATLLYNTYDVEPLMRQVRQFMAR